MDYTAFLGGNGTDVASGMAVDYGPAAGHHCGFVTKLTPDGTGLEFSICIPDLAISAFAMDPSGAMYLAVTNLDGSNSLMKLDRSAQTIVYAVPFGNNSINAITADPYGFLYVAGSSTSLTTTPGP